MSGLRLVGASPDDWRQNVHALVPREIVDELTWRVRDAEARPFVRQLLEPRKTASGRFVPGLKVDDLVASGVPAERVIRAVRSLATRRWIDADVAVSLIATVSKAAAVNLAKTDPVMLRIDERRAEMCRPRDLLDEDEFNPDDGFDYWWAYDQEERRRMRAIRVDVLREAGETALAELLTQSPREFKKLARLGFRKFDAVMMARAA